MNSVNMIEYTDDKGSDCDSIKIEIVTVIINTVYTWDLS